MTKFNRFSCAALLFILLFILATLSVYADPAPTPPATVSTGALTQAQAVTLVNGIQAQLKFINSSIYGSALSAVMITATETADEWQYIVYLTSGSLAPDGIPEELYGFGKLVPLSGTGALYRAVYSFTDTGGIGRLILTPFTNGRYQLATKEQILYSYRGFVGFSDVFPFATIPGTISMTAPSKWLWALEGYNLSASPSVLIDAQFQIGYLEGEAVSYSSGYEAGFTVGFTSGAGDLDTVRQSAYDDGYGVGYTTGYNRGVASVPTVPGHTVVQSYQLDVPGIITSIPLATKNLLNSAFGFELFGIQVAGLFSTLMIMVVLVFLVKWILGLGIGGGKS